MARKTASSTASVNTIELDGMAIPYEPRGYSAHDVPVVQPYVFPTRVAQDVALDLISVNKSVLLTGHASTGKSSLPEQLAARIGQPTIRCPLQNGGSISDFVGTWVTKGGELVWLDGMLPKAMREGYWLILDEIDSADPSIMSALNRVTEPCAPDQKRVHVLKERDGEVITAHPNFRVIATANTVGGAMEAFRHLYAGTQPTNRALTDRFGVYKINFLSEEDEVELLVKRYDFKDPAAQRLIRHIVQVVHRMRDAYEKEEIKLLFTTRLLFDWIEMVIRGVRYKRASTFYDIVIDAAQRCSIDALMTDEDKELFKQTLQRMIPKE